MPHTDPLEILLHHNHWATHQMLDACAPLSAEQFTHPFEMGPGSLHNTLQHMLGAMRFWADLLHHRPERPRLEAATAPRSVDELRQLLDEIHKDLHAAALAEPLDSTVQRTREGKTYTFNRAAVLTHITTHGVHHRAQCLNMLRHLGVKPLPPSAVTEWVVKVDSLR